MIFYMKLKDITFSQWWKSSRQHIKTGAGPLAELCKKNNQQKNNFKDQLIIPFIPSQRHISISHLLSPTYHPPSLYLKLTRPLLSSSTHFQIALVEALAMSHPKSTLHWINFVWNPKPTISADGKVMMVSYQMMIFRTINTPCCQL